MANEFVTRRGLISLGGITFPYIGKTSTYSISVDDYFVDCSGTFTVTLPTAVSVAGKIYVVKNSGSGTITIDTSLSQTIDGSLSKSLTQNQSISVQSNGTNWLIVFNPTSTGLTNSITELYNTNTIVFSTQSTITGLSASASIATSSITTQLLATGSNGGATAGYVLSNSGDGNFQWIPQGSGTSLDVVDYLSGTTFSSVSTMIFRGAAISVPAPGSTATGVSVTGPAPTVTVWIPAPNYVGYFTPTLASGTARYVTQPDSSSYSNVNGNSGIFGIGSWSPSTDFTSNSTRLSINSSSNLTAFTETEFACFNTGTTMSFTLYNHDNTVLSSINNYVLNGAGSTTSNGISITVNSFLADNDRYKANITGTISIGTLFPNGGRFKWNVTHYNGEGAGNSGYGVYSYTSDDLFYDNDGSSSSANISSGVDFDELSIVSVTYSGVTFYKVNSTFAVTASGINLINELTFPTTKQIDFSFTNLAIPGTLDGYANGTKAAGSSITGWTIDWNRSGLTFSRTATVSTTSQYIPGFSTNNSISSSGTSYVRSTIYDWSTVGFSQSVSKALLIDTYSPSSVTYNNNPIDSETGRLSVSGVLTNGSSAFDSTLSLTSSNVDELQYIFGRVIYPQTNFTGFYPSVNFTSNVNYSSLDASNKTFDVYTDINSPTTTSVSINGYRWHVTSYGKDASYTTNISNGIFVINSNFSESVLDYDGVNSVAGSGDLVILIGIDDTSNNTTPNKFLFISANPSTYPGRQNSTTYNLNKAASSKDIQFTKGLISAAIRKVWLFVGYKNTATGKNLNMTNISFS